MADTPAPSTPAVPSTAATFGDAQTAIDAQNRQLLAVMAGVHTQGDQGYQAQQAAGTADKQAALQQLLASAIFKGGGPGSIGVPPAADPNVGNVGAAFDQRIGTTGQLGAAFDAASQARSDAAGQYMREATAAVPIVEARTNEHIATLHAAAQAKATQDAMALQLEQYRLQAAQAAAAKTTTPGEIISSLGGQDLAGDAITTAAQQQAAQGDQTNRAALLSIPGSVRSMHRDDLGGAGQDLGPATVPDPEAVGRALGLPPGVATQLVGNSAATDKAQQTAAAGRADPSSDSARLAQLQSGPAYTADPKLVPNVQGSLLSDGYQVTIGRVQSTHSGMSYRDASLIVGDAYRQLSAADQKKVKS